MDVGRLLFNTQHFSRFLIQSQRQKKNIMSMISNDDGTSTQMKTTSLPATNARLSKKGGSSKVCVLL